MSATYFVLGVAGALALACLLLPAPHRRWPGLGFALLAYLDVSAFAHPFVRVTEKPPDDQEDRRFLAGLEHLVGEWRVYDEYVMEQRPGSRLGVRDFRGYPSGDPLEDVRYREVLARAGKRPHLLEAFNVKVVLHGPHHRNGKANHYLKQPPERVAPGHFSAIDERRFEALHAAPLVAWYGAARVVPDRKRVLDLLETEEPVALIERGEVPAELLPSLQGLTSPERTTGTLRSYSAHRIAFEVDAPARGVVVLNEKHFPGWRVEVDGKPAVGFRANMLLRAVLVDPGHHRIEWRYAPPGQLLLHVLFLAVIAFLGAAGGSLIECRHRGRHDLA
jgi:hypothetical protein